MSFVAMSSLVLFVGFNSYSVSLVTMFNLVLVAPSKKDSLTAYFHGNKGSGHRTLCLVVPHSLVTVILILFYYLYGNKGFDHC